MQNQLFENNSMPITPKNQFSKFFFSPCMEISHKTFPADQSVKNLPLKFSRET